MEYDPQADRRRREVFLTVLLTLIGGSAAVFFLILITGGLFLWLVLGVAAVAALSLVHYVLWGRVFSQNTAGEREEAELRAQMDLMPWDHPNPPPSHHT